MIIQPSFHFLNVEVKLHFFTVSSIASSGLLVLAAVSFGPVFSTKTKLIYSLTAQDSYLLSKLIKNILVEYNRTI